MGARTLVAVERPDGRYDLYHSQWGGEHVDRLVSLVGAGTVPAEFVDPEPLNAGVSAERLLDSVDPWAYETVVVGGERPEAYLVCRVGVDPDDRKGAAAALVPCSDQATADRIRRFLRTVKDVLGDAVAAGLAPPSVATGYVAIRLARHSDTPADPNEIIWLPTGGDSERERDGE